MGMNFPNSPTPGQVYTPVSGYSYVFLDGVWRIVQDARSILTADTRNRIVNGAMQISQENGITAVGTTGYPVDQFQLVSAIATVNAQKATTGINHLTDDSEAIYTSLTTAKPSLAASDTWQFLQYIEGINVADFRWGTAKAKQVVVRFSANCATAGTFTLYIKNHDATRTFMAPFTIATANTWQEFTIVVPGDTAGTWPQDNTRGMSIGWGLAAGSSVNSGVAGWVAGNGGGQMAGHTNLAATVSSFSLSNVGLYLDPLATGVPPRWQMPDEAEELKACQRYYHKIGPAQGSSGFPFGPANTPSTTLARWHLYWGIPMRIPPAIALSAPADFNVSTAVTVQPSAVSAVVVGPEWANIELTMAGVTAGQGGYIRNASSSAAVYVNARM